MFGFLCLQPDVADCLFLVFLSPGVICYLPSLLLPVAAFLMIFLWLPQRSAYWYWSSDITKCTTRLQFEDKIGPDLTEIGFLLLWTAGNSVPSLGRGRT